MIETGGDGGGKERKEKRERERSERKRKMKFGVEMTDASVIGVYLSCTGYFATCVNSVHNGVHGTYYLRLRLGQGWVGLGVVPSRPAGSTICGFRLGL